MRGYEQEIDQNVKECNNIIQRYKDAVERLNKNDDFEKEIEKLQQKVDFEKTSSRMEFEKYKKTMESRE